MSMFSRIARIKRQAGFTLTELTIAAGVVGSLAVVASIGYKAWDAQVRASELGDSLLPVTDAADSYVRKNWQQLQQAAPSIAGFANPWAPTVAELTAGKYLTQPFVQGGNLIGGNALVSVARTPVGCAPVNCDVAYTVYYDRPVVDGAGQPDIKTVAAAAARLGGAGGFSALATSALFTNNDGHWTATNPTGKAGVLAAYGSLNSSGNAAFVRTGDNRDPNLQANLTTAGTLTAGGGKASLSYTPGEGGTMTLTGADGQKMFMEQVAGRTRFINSGWTAELASIDQGGNLNTVGSVQTSAGVTSYGQVTAANGRVKIAAAAWAGWGCGEGNGTFTSDPNGQLLACKNGIWSIASAGGSKVADFMQRWAGRVATMSGTNETRSAYFYSDRICLTGNYNNYSSPVCVYPNITWSYYIFGSGPYYTENFWQMAQPNYGGQGWEMIMPTGNSLTIKFWTCAAGPRQELTFYINDDRLANGQNFVITDAVSSSTCDMGAS